MLQNHKLFNDTADVPLSLYNSRKIENYKDNKQYKEN